MNRQKIYVLSTIMLGLITLNSCSKDSENPINPNEEFRIIRIDNLNQSFEDDEAIEGTRLNKDSVISTATADLGDDFIIEAELIKEHSQTRSSIRPIDGDVKILAVFQYYDNIVHCMKVYKTEEFTPNNPIVHLPVSFNPGSDQKIILISNNSSSYVTNPIEGTPGTYGEYGGYPGIVSVDFYEDFMMYESYCKFDSFPSKDYILRHQITRVAFEINSTTSGNYITAIPEGVTLYVDAESQNQWNLSNAHVYFSVGFWSNLSYNISGGTVNINITSFPNVGPTCTLAKSEYVNIIPHHRNHFNSGTPYPLHAKIPSITIGGKTYTDKVLTFPIPYSLSFGSCYLFRANIKTK